MQAFSLIVGILQNKSIFSKDLTYNSQFESSFKFQKIFSQYKKDFQATPIGIKIEIDKADVELNLMFKSIIKTIDAISLPLQINSDPAKEAIQNHISVIKTLFYDPKLIAEDKRKFITTINKDISLIIKGVVENAQVKINSIDIKPHEKVTIKNLHTKIKSKFI